MTSAEMIAALRKCAATWNTIDDCNVAGCPFTAYGSMCIDTMLEAAADALEAEEQRISELEAQLPKEGEWVVVDDPVWAYFKCSICGNTEIPNAYKYCRCCGARMRRVNDEADC